jgi:hypothetical protein
LTAPLSVRTTTSTWTSLLPTRKTGCPTAITAHTAKKYPLRHWHLHSEHPLFYHKRNLPSALTEGRSMLLVLTRRAVRT